MSTTTTGTPNVSQEDRNFVEMSFDKNKKKTRRNAPQQDDDDCHHQQQQQQESSSYMSSSEPEGSATTAATAAVVVVLFYKYFLPSDYPLWHRHADTYYLEKMVAWQRSLTQRLQLGGRILIASEGMNATLAASSSSSSSSDSRIQEYIQRMRDFELLRDFGIPATTTTTTTACCGEEDAKNNASSSRKGEYIFHGIDWKVSIVARGHEEHNKSPSSLFPDLKISLVKEIISTNESISVNDIVTHGGRHLTPQQFHQAMTTTITTSSSSSTAEEASKEVVLIDVRNNFEYEIGHFRHPLTQQSAINPETVTFSSFEDIFCAKQADVLRDKKVLMYCTGGIRCEKASAMLRKRGVDDVSLLSGGIHRYLEEFGAEGYFCGRNFVFDKRVAVKPSECRRRHDDDDDDDGDSHGRPTDPAQRRNDVRVVGKCMECSASYDEISGARICTVCRDLVLVCPTCVANLRELHCKRHQAWKQCYFTSLEVFDASELEEQRRALTILHDQTFPTRPSSKTKEKKKANQKNVRRTLWRQIVKIDQHLQDLKEGLAVVDRNAPRRCRSCMQPRTVCNGLCWGFWKSMQSPASASKVAGETP